MDFITNKLFGNEKKGEKLGKSQESIKKPLSAVSSLEAEGLRYVKCLEDFIYSTEKLGMEGIVKQYRKLDRLSDPTMSFEAFKDNMHKNRYSDVFCKDSTRVKIQLDSMAQGDYIHANYVTGTCLANRFICTQGPLPGTVEDFWRMVYQERATTILMLCRPYEDCRPKCTTYWPDLGTENRLSCLSIKNINESSADGKLFEIIDLMIDYIENPNMPEQDQPANKKSLMVKLIKWPNWPDRGVPDEKCHTVPQRLLAMVRQPNQTCVVHCSAGIGRTGCMVALEFAYRKFSRGEPVVMEKIVEEIRRQRAHCVQTEVQYLYIHRVLVAFAGKEAGISEKAKETAEHFIGAYDNYMQQRNSGKR